MMATKLIYLILLFMILMMKFQLVILIKACKIDLLIDQLLIKILVLR